MDLLRKTLYFPIIAILLIAIALNAFESSAESILGEFNPVGDYPKLLSPSSQMELSGLTYSSTNGGSLFAISDNERLFEYSTTGDLIREITLSGFVDTEAITWMGGTQFAIAEERIPAISIVTITSSTTSISKPSAGSGNLIHKPGGISYSNNHGLEGLTYNPILDVFYGVIEKDSMRVTQIEMDGTTEDLFNVSVFGSNATDLAGIHYDSNSGNLFIISQESNRIFEVALDGTVLATLSNPGNQVEGIALTSDSNQMFVVGETRELYQYSQPLESNTLVPTPMAYSAAIIGFICLGTLHIARRRRTTTI